MSLESGRRVISDPLALRALAHPLRLRLHALVGREGSITAAEAARQLGVSQALASHHLRQLAKYGYVEPAEAGDQRERPWRVTATSQRYEPGTSPEAWESVEALERHTLERMAAQFADWQQRRPDDEDGWADQTGISQNLVYLTRDELAAFNRAWDELITPLVRRRPLGASDKRPAGAVPVDITLVATRLRATESGG
ncbi:helix-turn-helix domain-containing protein [Actinoplanes sp. NBRC 103695]|uniref:winged helix-turn-helix domain-containing protein n=1 Tax=Actinoplanes sp. NBRC 103695 TaxID=3032202 RepID=UPI0025568125|nr:helix-turn-helix domain-containing protein [Actinoplanes sp. NBRC 103695]